MSCTYSLGSVRHVSMVIVTLNTTVSLKATLSHAPSGVLYVCVCVGGGGGGGGSKCGTLLLLLEQKHSLHGNVISIKHLRTKHGLFPHIQLPSHPNKP